MTGNTTAARDGRSVPRAQRLVLLVEDDLDTREMYEMFLEHEGFMVITAADAEAALLVARDRRPAIVVTDFTLPRMSGLELGRQLRADAGTSRIPLILLTGHALIEDGGSFDTVLMKPCLPNALAHVINEVLRKTGD